MDKKYVNYAIQYLKVHYPHLEVNKCSINEVQHLYDYQHWLKRKLREEGIEERIPFEPVFTTNSVAFGEPVYYNLSRQQLETLYKMPF